MRSLVSPRIRLRTAAGLAMGLAALLLTTTSSLAQNNAPKSDPPANAPPGNAAPGNTAPPAAKPAPAPAPAPGSGNVPAAADDEKLVYITMKTTKGDIVIELNREKAPISVANFLSYVDRKFYDGLIFHRIVKKGPGSMIGVIQGGGFTKDLVQKATDKPIKNEWQNGLKNKRGTISMARTNQPDTATSQFFINAVDDDFLDKQQPDGAAYAVFGRVVAGMAVVDAIYAVQTGVNAKRMADCPIETIAMESVTRTTAADAKKAVDAEKKPATPAAPAKPATP